MILGNLNSYLRLLRQKPSFTIINLVGLTIGFSSFLIILVFVNYQQSFDQFHKNKSDIFRVNFAYQDYSGNVNRLVNSPPALANGVWGKFPELDKINRLRYTMNIMLANGEKVFYEKYGYFADSLFLEIFSFPLASGDLRTALDKPNSIVLSRELAIKYFNNPNPVGSSLLFNNSISLEVTGVLRPIPANTHLNFDFLISFSTYEVPEGYASDLTSWSWLGFLTYTQLKPGSDPLEFQEKLAQHFRDLDPEDETPMQPTIQNLTDIYLGSNDMTDDLGSHIRTGSKTNSNALMVVALLILIVSGFNFSNLTNAFSLHRTRSMGVKRVLGATQGKVRRQLLTETTIFSILCLILAYTVTWLLLPTLEGIFQLKLYNGYSDILATVPILILIAVLLSLMAGSYPAFLLSRYDVIKSLKGGLKQSSRNPFQIKNILVMLQFAISIGLIVSTLVMNGQINHMKNLSPGFDKENVIVARLLPEEMSRYFDAFKESLEQNTHILGISRSDRKLGDPWPFSSIQRADQDVTDQQMIFFDQVDYDYFKTLDISLSEGRTFSKEYVTERNNAIILNQTAASELGLVNPVGEQVHFFEFEGPRTIIGVVEDFNYTSLHQEIGPVAVILPFIDLEYMYIRIDGSDVSENINLMEDTWDEVSQGSALEWSFLDDSLNQLYQSEEKFTTLIQAFSVLAVFLACMGLYGILAFMINSRLKEFGVRKVLGASITSIYALILKSYLVQIVVSMLLIIPISNFVLDRWLNEFAYHIEIYWWVYPIATLILLITAISAISLQTVKAAKVNPAVTLKNE